MLDKTSIQGQFQVGDYQGIYEPLYHFRFFQMRLIKFKWSLKQAKKRPETLSETNKVLTNHRQGEYKRAHNLI